MKIIWGDLKSDKIKKKGGEKKKKKKNITEEGL